MRQDPTSRARDKESKRRPCLPWPEEAIWSLLSMEAAFCLVSRSRSLKYSFTHCCSVSRGLRPYVALS